MMSMKLIADMLIVVSLLLRAYGEIDNTALSVICTAAVALAR